MTCRDSEEETTEQQLVQLRPKTGPRNAVHHQIHLQPYRDTLQRPSIQNTRNTTTSNPEMIQFRDRPFDVVIFGASGAVGQFLVEELALVVNKYYNDKNNTNGIRRRTSSVTSRPAGDLRHRDPSQFAQNNTKNLPVHEEATQPVRRCSVPRPMSAVAWAIAGRSAVRLSETLCRAELSTGIRDLSIDVPVILADLEHHKSLLDMCSKSQLIVNCAGPYTEYAEALVKACIESHTNYIDLSHETVFNDSIKHKYSKLALERGIYIINGCGFQGMSAEMGLNFTKQVVDGRIEEVKIILNLSDSLASPISTRDFDSSGESNSTDSCVLRHNMTSLSLNPFRDRVGIITLGMWRSFLIDKAQEELPPSSRMVTGISEQAANSNQLAPAARRPSSSNQEAKRTNGHVRRHSTGDQDEETRRKSEIMAPTSRRLERKDTQALIRDIFQLKNRKNSTSWPMQLLRGWNQSKGRGYCWPIGSVTSDEAQLIRGEMSDYEFRRPDLGSAVGWRPIRCKSLISIKSFRDIVCLFLWLYIFEFIVRFSLLRKLISRLPSMCTFGFVANNNQQDSQPAPLSDGRTRQPPARDLLNHIKFSQTFIAYGIPGDDSGDPLAKRPDKSIIRNQEQLLVSRIVGPEPNHIATATYAVQAALTLIQERDHLPSAGGVLTPGSAFAETNIIYQLRRRNIKFEVLKKA